MLKSYLTLLLNMAKSSAVSLVAYASSSEDSDDEQIKTTETEGKRKQDRSPESKGKDEDPNQAKRTKPTLPLPDSIRQIGTSDQSAVRNDTSNHDGRIRSFPHEEGNWATLVYIPYEPEEEFYRLQRELFLCLRPLEFQPVTDYHVSLSRTVTIRHHWIQTLVESLKKGLGNIESCGLEIEAVKVYTNDENTRSFLALDVTSGSDVLHQYVSVVDECFKEYRLQEYYQPPSFHLSIGWCLGDVTAQIDQDMKTKLQDTLVTFLKEEPELQFFFVDTVKCTTGNKEFHFPLADS